MTSAERHTETPKIPTPSTIGRRRFLIAGAALTSIPILNQASFFESRAQAASESDQEPEQEGPEFDWKKLHGFVSEIEDLEPRLRSKPVVRSLHQDLDNLEAVFAPAAQSLEEVRRAHYTDIGPSGKPRLEELIAPVVGKMKYVTADELLPFNLEKEGNFSSPFTMIRKQLEAIVEGKGKNPTQNNDSDYRQLKEMIRQGIDVLDEEHRKEELQANCDGQVFVSIDPTLAVTPDGLEQFKKDAAPISEHRTGFPFDQNTCLEVALSSSRYGERRGFMSPPGVGGIYHPDKLLGGKIPFSSVTLFLDEIDQAGFPREYVYDHEAKGHFSDLRINRALARILPKELYLERLGLIYQIMNHEQYGAQDKTVAQIFRNYPIPKDVGQFFYTAQSINGEQFMGLISQYPLNALLSPGIGMDPEGPDKPPVWQSMMDDILGPQQPGNAKYDLPTKFQNDKQFSTLEEFLAEYYPMLNQDAQKGSLRAQVVKWGIDNYRKDLANFAFLREPKPEDFPHGMRNFVPKTDKSGLVWFNYLHTTVPNAAMIDITTNGVDTILSQLTAEEQESAEHQVISRRMMYQGELFAEGVATTHYFGNKVLIPGNPYQYSLDHFAGLLTRSQ